VEKNLNMQSGLCNKCKQEFNENNFYLVTSFHLEERKSDAREKHLK